VFLAYWKDGSVTGRRAHAGRLGRSQWVFIRARPQGEEEEGGLARPLLPGLRWLCQPFFVIRTGLLLLLLLLLPL